MKNDRRKLLKNTAIATAGIAAAGQLPGKWNKPVVESFTVPAHADTTCAPVTDGPEGADDVRLVCDK